LVDRKKASVTFAKKKKEFVLWQKKPGGEPGRGKGAIKSRQKNWPRLKIKKRKLSPSTPVGKRRGSCGVLRKKPGPTSIA